VNRIPSVGPPGVLKAVVFDMDDTLYLERDYVLSGFRHISNLIAEDARRTPEDILTFLLSRAENPHHRGHVLELLFAEYPEIARGWEAVRLVEEYRAHTPAISLLPGVELLLTDLRAAGAHLAVITDGVSASQHSKAKALRLTEYFDRIVVTDDRGIEYRKPHPYAYLNVSEGFGCEARACVYIGDNPAKDFLAPRRLGWETVRLRLRNQLHEAAEPSSPEAAPQIECRSVAELRSTLLTRLCPSSALASRTLIP